jgi:antagonist of KipI
MILDVLDGGLLTTVQDAGRAEWTHLGVPESGAADPWSLAVANLLLGNAPTDAALEITVGGPTLLARDGGTIALAGADLGARIAGGRPLQPGRSHRLAAGETIAFDGGRGGGARAYVAVPGGFDVPVVLGSRSTCLAAAFGGLAGRPLRAGDALRSHAGAPAHAAGIAWPDGDEGEPDRDRTAGVVLRVVPGRDPGLAELAAVAWRVGPAADRVGVRLDGPRLSPGIAGETLTHGVPWGAIQLPPDGVPIVLGADHQTTGGYRVPAVVIAADRPVLGQLLPGDAVRFLEVELDVADATFRDQRARLVAGARALRDAAGWERLVASAGG